MMTERQPGFGMRENGQEMNQSCTTNSFQKTTAEEV